MLAAPILEATLCAACPLVATSQKLGERVAQLQAQLAELGERLVQTEAQRDRAHKEAVELRATLGQLQRRRKRQAAPFSKGEPKPEPKKPGRVDEVLPAELPDGCPRCGGEIDETRVAQQFQVDLPPLVEPFVRQFDVHIGQCRDCHRRSQGRHPLQTSDALGAAASQIGPRALSLAADWKVRFALSYEMLAELFATLWQIDVTPGGLCQAVTRLSKVATPTYEALREVIQQADVVSPDETGWRVGGRSAWLWAFATETITFYAIDGHLCGGT